VSDACPTRIASSVFAGSTTAYYSYDTCGGPDCYSSASNPGCPYNPHGGPSYGVDKAGPCACMYQGVALSTSLVSNYPSSNPGAYSALPSITAYGTACAAWDQIPNTPWASYCPVHSDWCHQHNNWCQAAWCYVDESCPTRVPSSVFAGATAPAYYSYETCGAHDCYTGSFDENSWSSLPWACPLTDAKIDYYVQPDCKDGFTGFSKPVCKSCRKKCKNKCHGKKCKKNCIQNKCKHVCKKVKGRRLEEASSTESSSVASYV